MIIQVKQEHLDNGMRGNKCYCPVALALKEALKTENVVVTPGLYVDNVYIQASMDVLTDNGSTLYDRIGLIDCGWKLNPFSFEIKYND